jgi:hypothetical protein
MASNTSIGPFVELGTLGKGSCGHEVLQHVIVLEFVPDRVCVAWPVLPEKPLEVVCRWPRCTFVAAHGA